MSQPKTIYFDHNATTPLDPRVREAMLPFLGGVFGNPSSVHHVGRQARAILDDLRDRVAQVWRCKPGEVVFTSGGTESNNLAIFGAARLRRDKGRHLITSRIEHHSVLRCFEYLEKQEGFSVTYLPVNEKGLVAPDDLSKAIRPETILVSIMTANNEIGAIQPVAVLGEICRSRGVVFHTDAAQSLGKEPFESIHQFNAGLVSVCSHKFYGPKGAGALFVRSPLRLNPVLFGGSHENERRAGTENMAGIAGFEEALRRFASPPVFCPDRLGPLTARLVERASSMDGVVFCGPARQRLANTAAFTVEGCDSMTLLAGLDLLGICASSGSACSAGSLEPSHVLLALGVEEKLANSLVRFSLGRDSTLEEVEAVADGLAHVIKQARCL